MSEIQFKLKPGFLKKSAGPSELGEAFGTNWNNQSLGTTRAVTCEACLKEWPELSRNENDYTLSRFLGLVIVEQCCGALFDKLYRELGDVFVLRKIREVRCTGKERTTSYVHRVLTRNMIQEVKITA